MLRSLSLSPADLYARRQVQILLEAAAERDAAERNSRCGRACDDLAGFEDALTERLREAIE
jgi:hypothetical protein